MIMLASPSDILLPMSLNQCYLWVHSIRPTMFAAQRFLQHGFADRTSKPRRFFLAANCFIATAFFCFRNPCSIHCRNAACASHFIRC